MMPPRIYRRQQAMLDMEAQTAYLAQNAGPEIAQRFLQAVDDTLKCLAESQSTGSPCEFENPRAKGMRWWSIRGFDNHLVFFRHVSDGIEVVRVLHAAQDWQGLFQKN